MRPPRRPRRSARAGRARLAVALWAVVASCRTVPPPLLPPAPVPARVEAPPPPPPELPPEPPPKPDHFDVTPDEVTLRHVGHRLIADGGVPENDHQIFPEPYALVDGVVTFRGNPQRTGGAFGVIPRNPTKLEVSWRFTTAHGEAPWFGGSGWTGQPVIVKWPAVIRHSMTKLGPARFDDGFTEVIQGSLDGNVYFLDLFTGKPTRPPLRTFNPIKGSVSLDPRGNPLLFVGQGIPRSAPIGLRAYDLIRHEPVFFLPGHDKDSPRGYWGAFDSSGLLNRKTDTYLVGGENGLVYLIHLNTFFDPVGLTMTLHPEVTRYRYKAATSFFGVENSVSVLKNLAFFADNGGTLQAMDLRTFTPLWAFEAGDDTDASITVDVEGDEPVLYTGCEVDKTGPKGKTHLRRLAGLTGKQDWDVTYACLGASGPPRKIDAGVFATNAVGTGDVADLVYFTLARCPGPANGVLLALDKKTGKEEWKVALPNYSWSSPTLLHDEDGKTWVLQGSIGGWLQLFDARTGVEHARTRLKGDIEATPAAFGDRIVLGTRDDVIYGVKVLGGAAGK